MSSKVWRPSFILFLVFLVHHLTETIAIQSANYSQNDHVALLAIKSKLVDRPGGVLSSWNSSIDHCNWEGVTCGRKHNRVTVLDLHSGGLAGTISPAIGNLSFLQNITLYNNSLYGQIPSEIGRLFNLQVIVLLRNTLTGEIPANISGCVNLRQLILDYNKIEGKLPAGLGALSKLEILSVYNNNLTGPLFDNISNLTSLQSISTALNALTGTIPNSIGRMRNLTVLDCAENELSGTFPASIFNLSSLTKIDLTDCRVKGELPDQIGVMLPNLVWLSLYGNMFSGSIPSTLTNITTFRLIELGANSFTGKPPRGFGNLPYLGFLGLSNNYLTSDINFISELVNCSSLQILDLRQGGFTGELPESIGNLPTGLRRLGFGQNPISGSIPAGITNLINLVILDMSACNFSGSIPRDLGKLQNMESVTFDSNKLTGEIPSSLGDLSVLSTLYLQNNQLEGSVPPSLGNCQSLLYLNLSKNALTGSLGNDLVSGSAMFVELDLSHNQLKGSLPSEISKQTSLGKLRLSGNKFSGIIPDGLGACSALQQLYMDGNSFHGVIPLSFTSLTSLQEVDLSRNNLSGPIPASFSKFPLLHYLNLSYNDFEGRVPTNAIFANASDISLVGNIKLCGGISALHLPECVEKKITEKRKRKKFHSLKVILPSICVPLVVLTAAIVLYLIFIRNKRKRISAGPEMGKSFPKVSYDMLLKATDGFSSEKLLGAGTFGSVFEGILDGKTVAVKVINLQHRGASKSFLAECKALRNIRHRNLVGIITACSSIDFQKNDFKALVYEFMPNGSLDRWLNGDGNLSLLRRVEVAIDMAHALNYLHSDCETPIVHCDLKPSNILLDQDMVAHVGDFGLAKILTDPQHPNQSSTIGVRGTVGYAAPEYGLGSEASTDGDLYSYGIVLLELMTGKRPTDNMFREDYNLHMYVRAALPDQVTEIVDPILLDEVIVEEANDRRAAQDALQRKVECLASVVSIGVACSHHAPEDRMNMTDVISRLRAARDHLLNARKNNSYLPARDGLGEA